MLALIIIIVIAAVVVYIVRLVKPKRVRLRAGAGKFTLFEFEADQDGQSGEPGGHLRRADDLKKVLPGSEIDDPVLLALRSGSTAIVDNARLDRRSRCMNVVITGWRSIR